jgi:hypothetical protein
MSGLYLPSGISPARLRIEAAGRAHQASQARAASERNKVVLEHRMALAARRAERLLYTGPPTLHDRMLAVVREVCKARGGAKLAEIMGEGRYKAMRDIRMECYFIFREEFGLSFPRIGRFFKRDHTTVIHGYNKHKARMGTPETPFDG